MSQVAPVQYVTLASSFVVRGLSLAEAVANEAVFVETIRTTLNIAASSVSVAFSAESEVRRRLLDDSAAVRVTFTVITLDEAAAYTVATMWAAVGQDTLVKALVAAAVDQGLAAVFAKVSITELSSLTSISGGADSLDDDTTAAETSTKSSSSDGSSKFLSQLVILVSGAALFLAGFAIALFGKASRAKTEVILGEVAHKTTANPVLETRSWLSPRVSPRVVPYVVDAESGVLEHTADDSATLKLLSKETFGHQVEAMHGGMWAAARPVLGHSTEIGYTKDAAAPPPKRNVFLLEPLPPKDEFEGLPETAQGSDDDDNNNSDLNGNNAFLFN
jgi:hypothetical protein